MPTCHSCHLNIMTKLQLIALSRRQICGVFNMTTSRYRRCNNVYVCTKTGNDSFSTWQTICQMFIIILVPGCSGLIKRSTSCDVKQSQTLGNTNWSTEVGDLWLLVDVASCDRPSTSLFINSSPGGLDKENYENIGPVQWNAGSLMHLVCAVSLKDEPGKQQWTALATISERWYATFSL